MSRFENVDDYGDGPPPEFYTMALKRHLAGRKGQAWLQTVKERLEALPERRLVYGKVAEFGFEPPWWRRLLTKLHILPERGYLDDDGNWHPTAVTVCAIGAVVLPTYASLGEFADDSDYSGEKFGWNEEGGDAWALSEWANGKTARASGGKRGDGLNVLLGQYLEYLNDEVYGSWATPEARWKGVYAWVNQHIGITSWREVQVAWR